MKIICNKCNRIAVWHYAPSDGKGNYCDDCVPRGCSCNIIIEQFEMSELPSPLNLESIEAIDKFGRLFPCCEYDYNVKGFNQEDYD